MSDTLDDDAIVALEVHTEQLPPPVSILFEPEKHKYFVNGEDYPSVTQILDATVPKNGLPWWGMRIGMAGVVKLFEDNLITFPALLECVYDEVVTGKPAPERSHFRANDKKRRKPKTYIEWALQNAKLDINSVKDKAAGRGTDLHDEVVRIGLTEELGDLSAAPDELRPYLQAFAAFWFEQDPEIVEQEVLIASLTHRYAGRLDMIAKLPGRGRGVVDFKTTTGDPNVYDNHHMQVVLYKHGYEEMTGQKLDFAAVVVLSDTGVYTLTQTWSQPAWVLPRVQAYYGDQAFKAADPKRRS